ncbi:MULTISPECIES: hypothetical protein [unclassified Microbacterium]|uniref:hypothetical protein n=1 Tax=unclassified Microbacterium TaxID=2609290 RepID=UPI0008FC4534|nr:MULTISPECIES: hypothetical protein [unclassified Microbacterium]OIU88932.1 hypothetical protein BFN01_00005 [Microbacterium sp. AR7-10]
MTITLDHRAINQSPLALLTASEARMLGIGLGVRQYARVRAGIYVARAAYEKLPGWQRYAVRVHAFVRKHPDAVLCLESAAVLLGLPYFNEPKDIHVYDADRSASRRFGDVAVHTGADPRAVGDVRGVLTTSPVDTAIDLMRVLPLAQGLAVADAAISPKQQGFTSVRGMRDLGLSQRNRRGRGRMNWVLDHADDRAESPAESVSRAVIGWCGFEHPELQREFHYEGEDDRVDFLFPSVGAIGEADGWGKYDFDDPRKAEQHLRNEKRREDRLRRHGHAFARWDLSDVWKITPLVTALRAAGVPLKHPRETAKLASLKSRPREKPYRARETT